MQWTVWADHLLQFCLYETGKGLNSWFMCYHLPDNEHWVLIFLSIFVLLLLQNKWNVSYCKVSLTTWWSYGLQMNDRPANMLLQRTSLYTGQKQSTPGDILLIAAIKYFSRAHSSPVMLMKPPLIFIFLYSSSIPCSESIAVKRILCFAITINLILKFPNLRIFVT